MSKNGWRVVLASVCLVSCSMFLGCAQMAVKKSIKHYEEQLNPAIGKTTKDGFIKAWGPPNSTTTVKDGEVCVWHFSYGTRAVAGGNQYVATARAHEMYDKLTMIFNDKGMLQSWRVWCQR